MPDFNGFSLTTKMPEWVAWVAQDADGSWWGYQVEPNQYDHGWYENEIGNSVFLYKSDENPHWHSSLIRVE